MNRCWCFISKVYEYDFTTPYTWFTAPYLSWENLHQNCHFEGSAVGSQVLTMSHFLCWCIGTGSSWVEQDTLDESALDCRNCKTYMVLSCSCWGNCKMGQVEEFQCQPGIKTVSLMCPFGVQGSGFQNPLSCCMPAFSEWASPTLLLLLCTPQPLPPLCLIFLSPRQMQLVLLHVRTNGTSEETIASYRPIHTARETVLCRTDFQRLVCLCQNVSADSLVFMSLLN